ncbi:MAG: bifunctional diaminohydroxyphosphoribosylaminopyrimidine deaminase/5-amino-6-(5-phosphoribosylamino)uracil reductase RibD, partial [Pseudomonadota bacterium]
MLQTRHNSDDLRWMHRALKLAERMRGHVWPNPPVGCVIVKDGVVVSEAATHAGGRPHAERKALDQAGSRARGATLYVTLEPCSHWGKTPPCCDAIVEAEVARVVCAIRDPDPRVNGGGFARLTDAGVSVVVGLCAQEAERLMSGFFHRVRHGIPELVVVEKELSGVPPGFDASIVSSKRRPRLV